MKAPLYTQIFDETLVPFAADVFLEGFRFMQASNPKHTSQHAKAWIQRNNLNWWKTPAESSDLNPIENLWHKLKEFVRCEMKPKTNEELIDGIETLWVTVNKKCACYILHL